ncbi:MAG: transposase [Muribaculum sp.]|nr:transposase [Muribaculum sp.]
MDQYRKTPRANFIDYDYGDYFITICTKDKQHFLGEIHDGLMALSDVGQFVDNQLSRSKEFCEETEVIQYVVMPNHIHAIIRVTTRMSDAEIDTGLVQRNPNASMRVNSTCQRHVPTLSKYVSSLKGVVTKFAKANNIEFAWQTRYHDHLIRGARDGNNISEYISNNVAKWQEDCFYNEI